MNQALSGWCAATSCTYILLRGGRSLKVAQTGRVSQLSMYSHIVIPSLMSPPPFTSCAKANLSCDFSHSSPSGAKSGLAATRAGEGSQTFGSIPNHRRTDQTYSDCTSAIMSDDDERSDSESDSSDSEDLSTTGLIATRTKRATAGNLYASLRLNLEDEDLQRELLAEDEEDQVEYEGSDRDDDEESLESSSEEEDAGPPEAGAPEDLEGEQELQKAERAEARRKRKAHDARLRLPAWQKKSKKVKLADDVKTEDGSSLRSKPTKKSERANWLPTAEDAPIRQSARALAVANREVVHANLKQSFERSVKQRKVMKFAAEKDKGKERVELSQEQRLAQCAKIAKQTEKEFGRWEREEAERQRIRDEQLAAKRQRGVRGPFIRHWSGSALWVGDRIRENRVLHGSGRVEELNKADAHASTTTENAKPHGNASTSTPPPPQIGTASLGDGNVSRPLLPPSGSDSQAPPQQASASHPAPSEDLQPQSSQSALIITVPGQLQAEIQSQLPAPSDQQEVWLQGIHDYASQPFPNQPSQPSPPQQSLSSEVPMQPTSVDLSQSGLSPNPALVAPVQELSMQHTSTRLDPTQPTTTLQTVALQAPMQPNSSQQNQDPTLPPQQMTAAPPYNAHTAPTPVPAGPLPFANSQPPRPTMMTNFQTPHSKSIYGAWPPGSQHQFAVQVPQPPPAPAPLIRKQAQRSLIMLEHFSHHDLSTSSSRRSKNSSSATDPTDLAKKILPDSYPSLDPDEVRYLTTKYKRGVMPARPTKLHCAIIPHEVAKFRDPKTGLGYSDLQTYKMIQSVIAGECKWSALLGCWVGKTGGQGQYGRIGMGWVAKGVPDGFATPTSNSPGQSTVVKTECGGS